MKKSFFLFIAKFVLLSLTNISVETVFFKEPESIEKPTLYKDNAIASYYANMFNGRKTANGEIFHNNNYTAAHKTLPFGTIVKVTNLVNDKSVIVKINDRGPFIKGREIDLSRKTFMEITDNKRAGLLKVKIEIINPNNKL
ncbi:septal ring lytic transglycosylase RlpA family protein [uncultured Flavobacterium sp.]|uniref:septal ring lytic transglycosylase RlpA family protein n=1 Tax=uncultured Flavobacterium sp. TaxID=165435 RepID=UPI0025FE2ADF|nr:septal ring lytic transglycosylase RlpA family protein [uncultured Flavobacterium sp.]